MPLRSDLLNPIPGANPSGTSLRYDRVYDQIKEARTEEDESLPSGGWARQVKKADFRVAAKLAGDALATRSKDLQLAVWLGEALFKLEGASILAPILRLCLDLQQNFWETLYPEIDEGDLGLRAVPLQWAATRYAKLLNEAALTRKGIGILEYKAARALGTEAEANASTAKREAREEAVAAGRLTSEDVDDAIKLSPKSFYVALEQSFSDALEALGALDLFCEERYGDDSPSFRNLRTGLEEVQNLASSLLREKRRLEPDPVAAASDAVPESEAADEEPEPVAYSPASYAQAAEEPAPVAVAAATPAAARPKPQSQTAPSATPTSWDDALARIAASVQYLAAQKPESPLPFLLSSAMRLGELYQLVVDSRLHTLAAPPTEVRQQLKRAAGDREWSQLHTTAIAALATPCGAGWLDLYRYLWTSCDELGWYTQRNAIANSVKQRLRDLPELSTLSLDDDTASANAETLRWIDEYIAPPAPVAEAAPAVETPAPAPNLEAVLAAARERASASSDSEPDAEDLYITARGLAAHGQIQAAIQLLARDAAHQSVGRLRFNRNLQIAELCLESGNSAVAVPVLQALVREVEDRRLESWEPPESTAKPYALLLQCAAVAKLDTQSIFARLCAIDPGAALTMAPPIET